MSRIFLNETMGKNAAIGAACILLACITAQSEQIMELLGVGKTPGEEEESVGEDGAMDSMKGQHDEPLLAEGRSETMPISILDAYGAEPSTEMSEDQEGRAATVSSPVVDHYVMPLEVYAGKGGP